MIICEATPRHIKKGDRLWTIANKILRYYVKVEAIFLQVTVHET